VLSYPLQTLLNFAVAPKPAVGGTGSTAGGRTASNPSRARYRPEIPAELRDVPAANDFRRKIEFVRAVVREWVAHGGIGNGDTSRERRLRWTGIRETKGVPIPAKHVWVTIGARAGDERLTAYFDPRRPGEIGEDVDERKEKRRVA